MRSINLVFIFSLFAACSAQAVVINLKSIFNSKTTGQLTITEAKSTVVQYQLNVEYKDQAYGILMYKTGSCANFSSPTAVAVNDPANKEKNIPFNSKGNQFLIFQPASKQTTLTGTVSAPNGSYFSFEPRGKIFVLFAIDSEKSDSGKALACGIYP